MTEASRIGKKRAHGLHHHAPLPRLRRHRVRHRLPRRLHLRLQGRRPRDVSDQLYIHPDECIDCEACVPECPVEAIFHEDNLPDEWKEFTALNAEECPKCPVITEKKDALESESCDQSRKKK